MILLFKGVSFRFHLSFLGSTIWLVGFWANDNSPTQIGAIFWKFFFTKPYPKYWMLFRSTLQERSTSEPQDGLDPSPYRKGRPEPLNHPEKNWKWQSSMSD